MSTDIDAVDIGRELIGLEEEARTIDGAIGAAVRAGDLVTADALSTRRDRLPLLIGAARAYQHNLDIAELQTEASAIDARLPELIDAVATANADLPRAEEEAKRIIRAARLRAATALGEMRAAQDRRRAVEARIGETRAALAAIGAPPPPAPSSRGTGAELPALRVAMPGESCARPDMPEYVIDPAIGRI